jgi:phosphoadenosine phosphosulfate reductase
MTEQRNKRQFKPGKGASIHWCPECNLPLISIECALCNSTGQQIELGPPGDVRFCSPYERSILYDILTTSYGIDPLGERIILLNKIGGEDKTDQVIVDALVFGILRFDLKTLDWQFDLSMDGAALMAQYTKHSTSQKYQTMIKRFISRTRFRSWS